MAGMGDTYSQTASGGGMEESASRMGGETPAPKPGAWTLDSLRIEPTANGGFVVNCSKRRKLPPSRGNGKSNGIEMSSPSESTYDSKQYAFSTADEALAYVVGELKGSAPSTEAQAAADDDAEMEA